jgi:hypothetical protein
MRILHGLFLAALIAAISDVAVAAEIADAQPVARTDTAKLDALVAAHIKLRASFSAEQREALDALTERLRGILQRKPDANAWRTVNAKLDKTFPDLTRKERKALATYVLDAIAAKDGVDPKATDPAQPGMTQGFAQQYMELQSPEQVENRDPALLDKFTGMEHDIMMNTIRNIQP